MVHKVKKYPKADKKEAKQLAEDIYNLRLAVIDTNPIIYQNAKDIWMLLAAIASAIDPDAEVDDDEINEAYGTPKGTKIDLSYIQNNIIANLFPLTPLPVGTQRTLSFLCLKLHRISCGRCACR